MSREAIIIGSVKDFWGDEWDVRETRPTTHGFDLCFGWPSGCRGKGFGGPGLICTTALNDYFKTHALDRNGSIYDLPAGRTTIKRVRLILGFNLYAESAVWWEERTEDLTDLPGVEFAKKHAVPASSVSIWRKRLIGKRLREPFWWRENAIAELLQSNLPRAFVAQKLAISVGSVGRLRWLVRKGNN
jgi:hypothetical protein